MIAERVLSVRRPWVNLLIAGFKPIENRTWTTSYRGLVCLHGGQTWEPAGARLAAELGIAGFDDPSACPSGYLGIAELVDVHPVNGCCAPWGEQQSGVYHWVFTAPRAFATPMPGRGRLGLYPLPHDVREGLLANVA